MRWVLGRGGSKWMVACALLGAACDEADATTPPQFTSGGAVTAGASAGGAVTTGGSTSTGTGAQPTVCASPPMRFALTRYSVADIDNSLDLVFGEGSPRLAEVPFYDAVGYQRDLSWPFVTALLGVARERVKQAAALGACDADCLGNWLRLYGDQLYHRPLTDEQVEAYRVPFLAAEGEEARAEVAASVLVAMVLSPYFLLPLEVGEASGRISADDVAARLAHFAARRIPDAELRAKAASGEIYDPVVRLMQLRRMWQTPAGRAARELQMLEWLGIPTSPTGRVPAEIGQDMLQQARDLISRIYDEENGSLSAFFTSSRLPLNDRLAEHYGLPLPGTKQLEPVELDQQLFAGLLSTGAFLTRYPRPSQRGVGLMSALLCVDPPTPPPDGHGEPLPVLETPRLSVEAALEGRGECVRCHDTFDPAGFALEAFDEQGRLTGFPTDGALRASQTAPSTPVSGPVPLGKAATSSPEARDCLQRRGLEMVTRRAIPAGYFTRVIAPPDDVPERAWMSCLSGALAAQEPSVTALMETIAMSDLMVTRDDQRRRVVALDTSLDPLEHAYQEALQLRAAYGDEDYALLEQYAASLMNELNGVPPTGVAGAGGDAGASNEGGAGGAGGAP